MSTCTKWVDRVVITCKNWAEKVDYECTEWADEGSNKCSQWADEGSNKCSEWADEGSNKCCTWRPCSWGCKAFYWVSKWVCKGWYWAAKWVCKAWYWAAKWVCKAFAWFVKAVCVVWSWGAKLICVAWDTIRCMFLRLFDWIRGSKKGKPKIDHIFVLMLENRSFDHMLGFSDIRGTDAVTGNLTSINGVDPAVHNNPLNNNPVPVHFPADFTLKDIDEDPGHDFDNTITQLCGKQPNGDPFDYPDPDTGGYPLINNSGFVMDYADTGSTTPERIMDCFTEEQLPILHTLAREFAVCDNWFSSMPGPTFPNRFFIHAATSGGLDDHPSDLNLVAATAVDGFRFENGNIFDALDGKCIQWEIFEGDEFPVVFTLSGMNLNALQGRFTDFDEFEEHVNKAGFDKKFIFIEPKYGKHEFDVLGPGDFTCGNSMHPLDDITRGEKLIKKTYEVIRNSPHWEKSVLLIVFDEHGGFYDHVAPPAAIPPGDLISQGMNFNNFAFDQLGVRVPAIVVSPLVKKGTIDHTEYDHTSLLATLERLLGLKNLTERDKAAKDFLHLFSLETPRTDTPDTLPEAADSGFRCDDDEDESEEGLIAIRSEFMAAKKQGKYKERSVEEMKVADSQVGFNYIALLKVLQTAKYPYRDKWIENFKNIKTGIDAAIFMTEAKLQLKHDIDFNKILLESAKFKRRAVKNRRSSLK